MHQKFAPVTSTILLLTSCSSTSRDFQCEMFQVYRASGKKTYWRFKKKKKGKKKERNRRKRKKKKKKEQLCSLIFGIGIGIFGIVSSWWTTLLRGEGDVLRPVPKAGKSTRYELHDWSRAKRTHWIGLFMKSTGNMLVLVVNTIKGETPDWPKIQSLILIGSLMLWSS